MGLVPPGQGSSLRRSGRGLRCQRALGDDSRPQPVVEAQRYGHDMRLCARSDKTPNATRHGPPVGGPLGLYLPRLKSWASHPRPHCGDADPGIKAYSSSRPCPCAASIRSARPRKAARRPVCALCLACILREQGLVTRTFAGVRTPTRVALGPTPVDEWIQPAKVATLYRNHPSAEPVGAKHPADLWPL